MLRHHGLFDFSGNILYKTNKHRFLRFFFYIINHGIHFFTPDLSAAFAAKFGVDDELFPF